MRVRQGAGITRDRYGLEGADLPSLVAEIRGGAVAIEQRALGGAFTGVTFLAVVRARLSRIYMCVCMCMCAGALMK